MERDFKWIWIPKEIWTSQKMTLQEKVFFVEIGSLDNDQWCFATNEYFMNFFWLWLTRVSSVIKSLISKGFITSKLNYKPGTKQVLNRILRVCFKTSLTKVGEGYVTKQGEGPSQMWKDNNTYNNTTSSKEEVSSANEKKKPLAIEVLKNYELLFKGHKRRTNKKLANERIISLLSELDYEKIIDAIKLYKKDRREAIANWEWKFIKTADTFFWFERGTKTRYIHKFVDDTIKKAPPKVFDEQEEWNKFLDINWYL
jgi:hypothetical protein